MFPVVMFATPGYLAVKKLKGYSFFAKIKISIIQGIKTRTGANKKNVNRMEFSLISKNKLAMLIQIRTMDQKINLWPPYLLILYQFSSDSKAFFILTPYSGFILIEPRTKGILIAIISKPVKI